MNYCRICGRTIQEHKVTGDVCAKVIKGIEKKNEKTEKDRLQKSQDYIYARKSTVPNLGVEIPGAARISFYEYKNAGDIESQGPLMAKKLILKKNLIANMPINTDNATIDDVARLSVARKAIDSYPKGPVYPKDMDKINEDEPVLALIMGHKSLSSIITISQDRERLEKIRLLNRKTMHLMDIIEFDSLESIRKKIRNDYFDRFKYVQNYFNDKNNFLGVGKPDEDAKKFGETFFKKYFDEFGIIVGGSGSRNTYSIHRDDTSFFNKMRCFGRGDFLKNKLDEDGLNETLSFLAGEKIKGDDSEEKKNTKPKALPFNPIVFYRHQTLERIGPLPVEKGIDDIIGALENKWGFKGVQNGNTVKDNEREEHYHQANMALQDLMDSLNIKDHKKMTFNGGLSLAIGSLKGARNALAFYRPDVDAIALSRKNGLGALAHEWGHALENHFVQKNKNQTIAGQNSSFKNKLDSFVGRMKGNEDFAKAPTNHKTYLKKDGEVFARVFEAMVNYKLEKMGRKNTYLVAHDENYAYPTKDELKNMESDFDKVVGLMIQRS